METGRHEIKDICLYAKQMNVKVLCFNHRGREILENKEQSIQYVNEYASLNNIKIYIANDGQTVEVNDNAPPKVKEFWGCILFFL